MSRKHSAAATRPRSRVLSFLGSTALNVLAALGAVCIVLVILGLTMNMSLIMFSTGSMSPTIPAGSVALVQEIDAADIEVGDVVTVERPGKLPVTHRVVAILAQTDASTTFTMKGDANEQPDTEPYTAQKVRIVRGSVPGLANVVTAFQNPFVLGALTLGATALVTWAFWPRKQSLTSTPSH